MRISRKLAALAAFFVIGAAVAGCGSSIPGNSVASVAGTPISLQAFQHWMYVFAKSQAAQYAAEGIKEPPIVSSNPTNFSSCVKAIRAGIPQLRTSPTATLDSDCKQVFSQDSTAVLNFLIESYWLQAEANRVGINASKVDAAFGKAILKEYKTTKAFDSYLNSTGQTREDQLFQYRVSTLYEKLLKRNEKKVTSAAIASYYNAHKAGFGTPESRDLHLVRTKTEAEAQAAYNALKSGQSWDTVAKKYAADASSKADGGLVNGVSPSEYEAAVSKVIFSASPNTIVGPIKGVFGSYVLEVTKITAATQESLAKATPAIKSQLTSTESSAASTKVLDTAKNHWKSKTTCRAPHYLTTNCSNYTAPATTTSATPTPTTTATTTSSTPTTSATGTATSTVKTATTASTTTKTTK